MRPTVTLSPVKPQNEAGMRTDPPVSVPIAQGAMRAATATPEPLLAPPGVRAALASQAFHGRLTCCLTRTGRGSNALTTPSCDSRRAARGGDRFAARSRQGTVRRGLGEIMA